MKILFIFSVDYPVYPFQIAALSSLLKKNGHDVEMLMSIVKKSLSSDDLSEIEMKIKSFDPGLIAFSAYEMSFEWIKLISSYIKQGHKLPIIVGGYYATLCPQKVIDHPSIDIVCRGEGEHALLGLVEKMEQSENITRIKNLWIKHDGKVFRNPVGSLIEDLDKLPFVDRAIMNYQSFLNLKTRGERTAEVMCSRGCPFTCSYCSNPSFRQLYPNKQKYVRYRSVANVLDEIDVLSSKYQFERLIFHDDTFTLSSKWLKEFCDKYPKRFDYPFSCNGRPETCTMENLKILKNGGCYLISIGVESGDETYRKNFLRRNMTNSQIISAFSNGKKVGLWVKAFNMVGLPFETRRGILKTLLLNARIAPDSTQTGVFYPFEGTELGDLCYEKNLVDMDRRKDVKTYIFDSILNLPTISKKEVRIWKYLISLTALIGGNPESVRMIYRSAKEAVRSRSLDQAVMTAQHLKSLKYQSS